FLAVIIDNMPAVSLGNCRLIVRQVGHQVLVALLPVGITRRIEGTCRHHILNTAAKRNGGQHHKSKRTHGHESSHPLSPVPATESARKTLTQVTPIIPAIRIVRAKSAPDCCRNVALVYPPFTTFRVRWP